MLFEDRTLENILSDLKGTVGSGISLVDQNGYAETADREHLILRAKERGIEPFAASNAIWKASLNAGAGLGVRFSAGELTYICTEVMGDGKCRLMCEQAGARGNIRQEGLAPIEYTEGFESGELMRKGQRTSAHGIPPLWRRHRHLAGTAHSTRP